MSPKEGYSHLVTGSHSYLEFDLQHPRGDPLTLWNDSRGIDNDLRSSYN
jgi:hypothetical protein